ncbi:DUF3693 domain-containing protein [Xanthomonas arboricola pv. corylina]
MNVGRAAVSRWRSGLSAPDAVSCAAIAGWTGEPLAKVLGIVGEARAISADEKAVWRKLAATAMTLVIGVSLALPVRAEAVMQGFEASPSIHYAKSALRAARARLRWIWLWIKSCLPNRSPRETELAA